MCQNKSQFFSFASILWSAAIAWTLNAATHMGGGASGGGGGGGGGGGDVRRFHAVIWSISAFLVALPWAGGVLVGSSLLGVRLVSYARTIYLRIITSKKMVVVKIELNHFSCCHRCKMTCGGKWFRVSNPKYRARRGRGVGSTLARAAERRSSGCCAFISRSGASSRLRWWSTTASSSACWP